MRRWYVPPILLSIFQRSRYYQKVAQPGYQRIPDGGICFRLAKPRKLDSALSLSPLVDFW